MEHRLKIKPVYGTSEIMFYTINSPSTQHQETSPFIQSEISCKFCQNLLKISSNQTFEYGGLFGRRYFTFNTLNEIKQQTKQKQKKTTTKNPRNMKYVHIYEIKLKIKIYSIIFIPFS